MFERFKKNGDNGRGRTERGGVATTERPATHDTATDERRFVRDGGTTAGTGVTGAEAAREVRARQREEFGGTNWGAAFFGWLVAVGMAAILAGILSAAGAALGFTETSDANEAVSVVGGALLVAILCVAYLCGGYVSGRMSRFDGGRQGFGTWVIGLLVTILLGVAGWIAGSEYNVFADLDLPRIPVDEGDLTAGGAIALAALVIGSLVFAVLGGKAGERYHRKVDRVGYGV
jgi:hypothetical protein